MIGRKANRCNYLGKAANGEHRWVTTRVYVTLLGRSHLDAINCAKPICHQLPVGKWSMRVAALINQMSIAARSQELITYISLEVERPM